MSVENKQGASSANAVYKFQEFNLGFLMLSFGEFFIAAMIGVFYLITKGDNTGMESMDLIWYLMESRPIAFFITVAGVLLGIFHLFWALSKPLVFTIDTIEGKLLFPRGYTIELKQIKSVSKTLNNKVVDDATGDNKGKYYGICAEGDFGKYCWNMSKDKRNEMYVALSKVIKAK